MFRSGLWGATGALACSLLIGAILCALTVSTTTRFGIGFEVLQSILVFVPIVVVQTTIGFFYGITRAVRVATRRSRGVMAGVVVWTALASPFVLLYIVFLTLELTDARPTPGEHSDPGSLPSQKC